MSPKFVIKSEVQAKLLDSAISLAASKGWAAVTVRKVANNVGYSQAVVYDYFGSKDGMIIALAERGFDILLKALTEAYVNSEGPNDRIAAMAMAYWNVAMKHPELYQTMFGLEGAGCKKEVEIPEAQQAIDITHKAVVELTSLSGRTTDSYMAFVQLWSFLHGIVALNMAGILEKKTEPEAALNYAIANYIQSYK